MEINLNEYIIKRIEELTEIKSVSVNSLKSVTKNKAKLTVEEEKEILEEKMNYYLAAGALAEMEELKRVLNFLI
ncbi:hypothetical protein QNH20_04635 [Neobacillus sp. WH10]|uniref:hypothetical protein n=1 Tax=Neobacillus sp. WH10 TaxID=3047873 RepID=UPI0024C20AE3|nr:hypothetical protein [Neobacillus sp. WH10]WHY78440.1 hypothetical protein QNH20_04635 [Neobacillus sp. WH10]